MLTVLTIGGLVATNKIIGPYVQQFVNCASTNAHSVLVDNCDIYKNVSLSIEWICDNPKCAFALADQTPKSSSITSYATASILGCNCLGCGKALQYSYNVSPVTKYICIAGLCDIDSAAGNKDTILALFERRQRRDVNKPFTPKEFDEILAASLTINSYLKKAFAA